MAFDDDQGRAVATFRYSVKECSLKHIPAYTKDVLKRDAWRLFKFNNILFKNETFSEFLLSPPAKGCGFDSVEMVEALLKKAGDEDALKLFRSAVKGKLRDGPGGDFVSEKAKELPSPEGCSKLKYGDNNEYWQAVIERDRPELVASIAPGASARKVATAAGLRVEKTTLDKLCALWEKATEDERSAFRKFTDPE